MRRNNEEFVKEVFDRSTAFIAKRNRRIKAATTCISVGLCIGIAIFMTQNGFLAEDRVPLLENDSASPETDGKGQESYPEDEGIGEIYPGTDDGFMDESGDDQVDGIPEDQVWGSFRGMEIIDIEGNTITLLDSSGYTVIYQMTENGLYDVAKEELLKLSQWEKEFWDEIFSAINNK